MLPYESITEHFHFHKEEHLASYLDLVHCKHPMLFAEPSRMQMLSVYCVSRSGQKGKDPTFRWKQWFSGRKPVGLGAHQVGRVGTERDGDQSDVGMGSGLAG